MKTEGSPHPLTVPLLSGIFSHSIRTLKILNETNDLNEKGIYQKL